MVAKELRRILYTICSLKLCMTAAFVFGGLTEFYFLNIIAVPSFLLAMYNEKIFLFCLVGIALTSIIWCSILVFAFLGIKQRISRRIALVLVAIANAIDTLTSFMSPNFIVWFPCALISALVLVFSAVAIIYEFKKKPEEENINEIEEMTT